MEPIIEIRNLSKRYDIQQQRTEYLSLREQLFRPFRPSSEYFWALKDLNIDIQAGECLGIIGRNGAGKSTLLKILSRITPPTEGYIKMRGRVASLLEVGTGFHMELNGRENIYLNGSILGLRRDEIRKKYDEIVDFSGVEQFLETPLKHYSSGMRLRLAFAVAAHLEPEILLIDEVLAVGDSDFQKKCIRKMGEVSNSGRTILFVSHDLGAIKHICEKSVIIRQGHLVHYGNTEKAISHYIKNTQQDIETTSLASKRKRKAGKVYIEQIDLLNENEEGVPHGQFISGEKVIIQITYQSDGYENNEIKDLKVGMVVYNQQNQFMTVLNNLITSSRFMNVPTQGIVRCCIDKIPFIEGVFTATLFLRVDHRLSDKIENAITLNIQRGAHFELSLSGNRQMNGIYVDQRWTFHAI